MIDSVGYGFYALSHLGERNEPDIRAIYTVGKVIDYDHDAYPVYENPSKLTKGSNYGLVEQDITTSVNKDELLRLIKGEVGKHQQYGVRYNDCDAWLNRMYRETFRRDDPEAIRQFLRRAVK
jgi:hypothetical protein